MIKYRVPIEGAVLVEANTAAEAEVHVRSWTASVYQITVGRTAQPVPLQVKAVYIDVNKAQIQEITKQLQAKIKELAERLDPRMIELAKALDNHFGDDQEHWNFFERERKKGEEPQNDKR